MRIVRLGARALMASILGAGGVVAAGAGTATANHLPAPPACLVVEESTTLTGDITDCPTHGIVVRTSNVTLDLNGHTVSGRKVAMENVGILLLGVKNVTVRNGTVTGFDAGVSIEFGGSNIVTGINAHDNVNDMIEDIDPRSIQFDPQQGPSPEQMDQMAQVECYYGDGITTFDSRNNKIVGNTVVANGPYSGISLVGDSDGNVVSGNVSNDNDLRNKFVTDSDGDLVYVVNNRDRSDHGRHTSADDPDARLPTSMCGATEIGTPGMGRGREIQSIGIRIEGPGADNNAVEGNDVDKGGLAGISVHSYVKFPAATNVEAGSPNTHNVVRGNRVTRTGTDTVAFDPFADGIASMSQGPVGRVTFPSNSNYFIGNTVADSRRNGITLDRHTFDNTVSGNSVTGSGRSGFFVGAEANKNRLSNNAASGSGLWDGEDANDGCGTNKWAANAFGTVNQPCVATGTGGGKPSAGGAASAVDPSAGGIAHGRR